MPAAVPDTYIRGGGGAALPARKVLGVVAVAGAVLLLVVAAVTLAGLGAAASTRQRLRAHGVRVAVTVTGCRALASGTGITAAGYVCRGAFDVDGRRYTRTIQGLSTLHPVGETLSAVVLPSDPSSLTARAARP